MANEVELLTPALEAALAAWENWKKGKTLLEHYSLGADILDPLAAAIEGCDVYKAIVGKPIFSGFSGVVIFASTLAAPLLYRAEPEYRMGIAGAIAWFKKVLTTTHAAGNYEVAVWGIKPDTKVEIAKGCLLQPYDAAPDSSLKRRIKDLTRKSWDGAVWHSARFFGVPGAIMTQTVAAFPYLGRPDLSFQELHRLDEETKDLLAFLQASVTGNPLVGASWFSYEDQELDFNSHENHLSWCVPEVEPIVREHALVKVDGLSETTVAFFKLPQDYREKVIRSADRFVLSQCRHQRIDRILDLAIAFEIMTGGGKGDNAPPGWKVSVRSAQLIGGALAYRQKVRDALSSLYRFRNAGSHGGSPKAAEVAEQDAVFNECSSIYRVLVDSVLALGTTPDWPSIELEPRTRK